MEKELAHVELQYQSAQQDFKVTAHELQQQLNLA